MDIITENVHNVNIAKGINVHFSMCVERDGEGGEKGEKEGGRMGKNRGFGGNAGKSGVLQGIGKSGGGAGRGKEGGWRG